MKPKGLNNENNSGLFEYNTTYSYDLVYKIINNNLQNPHFKVAVHSTQEEIEQLTENGFLVRKNVINSQTIIALRKAIDKLVELEMAHPNREYYPGNGIFIRYLVDKDPIFINLIKYPPILSVIRAMLGPQVQLMDIVGRVSFLNEQETKLMWHIHNRVIPNPLPPFFSLPHSLDALIYLDDLSENTGPLCVIPGSHKKVHLDFNFRDNENKDDQVCIFAGAGDCIFSHSNLWHRVIPSQKQDEGSNRRRVILLGFMPAWYKKEFPKGVIPEFKNSEMLKRTGDNEYRELLGEFQWI